MQVAEPEHRRRHNPEIKRLALCAEPGASVAQIALSHGLNANHSTIFEAGAMNAQTAWPGMSVPTG